MKTNVDNPVKIPTFHAITTSTFAKVAGAAGYVTTDISSVVPPGTLAVQVAAYIGAVGQVGCRETGSTYNPAIGIVTNVQTCIGLCRVNGALEIDLLRDALLDITYYVNGYAK